MKKEKSHKPSFWEVVFWIFIITIVFTSLDYLVHSYFPAFEVYYYPVPHSLQSLPLTYLDFYAIGKFFGTFILGIILYYILRRFNLSTMKRALWFTIVIIVLLQLRYISTGYYTWDWHLRVMSMHFIILFITSFLVFRAKKI